MKARLVLLASFFLLTPVFLFSLIFYQVFLSHQNSQTTAVLGANTTSGISYQAVPTTEEDTTVTLTSREARVDVLREFFGKYGSPLEAYADDIVTAADKYGLDYRLVPAIAMQESTLCLKAPKDTNNCWGFGIYGKK
ncbi:MAG TPA: hypothetical protein VHE53_02250, partial [Patescibacteria group bacterium]|nr:hypothetical protein [Patescibacteria group bacterium]